MISGDACDFLPLGHGLCYIFGSIIKVMISFWTFLFNLGKPDTLLVVGNFRGLRVPYFVASHGGCAVYMGGFLNSFAPTMGTFRGSSWMASK